MTIPEILFVTLVVFLVREIVLLLAELASVFQSAPTQPMNLPNNMKNTDFASLDLGLGHSINMADSTVEFGSDESLKTFTSCQLAVLPTVAELAAVGELLMGGADWASINDVLKSLASQKTGKA